MQVLDSNSFVHCSCLLPLSTLCVCVCSTANTLDVLTQTTCPAPACLSLSAVPLFTAHIKHVCGTTITLWIYMYHSCTSGYVYGGRGSSIGVHSTQLTRLWWCVCSVFQECYIHRHSSEQSNDPGNQSPTYSHTAHHFSCGPQESHDVQPNTLRKAPALPYHLHTTPLHTYSVCSDCAL